MSPIVFLWTFYLKCRSGPASNLIDVAFGVTSPSPLRNYLTSSADCDQSENAFHANFINKKLDPSQKDAVTFALQKSDVAIVHGPPGWSFICLLLNLAETDCIYEFFSISELLIIFRHWQDHNYSGNHTTNCWCDEAKSPLLRSLQRSCWQLGWTSFRLRSKGLFDDILLQFRWRGGVVIRTF